MSDRISTLLESNRTIRHRIAQVADQFIRVYDDFLKTNVPDISFESAQQKPFIDHFQMIDKDLVHARTNANNPALAVCGRNSSEAHLCTSRTSLCTNLPEKVG